MGWVDARFPATETYEVPHVRSTTPRRTSTSGTSSACCPWWCWSTSWLTGFWLTMMYTPDSNTADDACRFYWLHHVRDVEYGWLLRYMHSTGASAFFVVVYLHMFRGLLLRLLPASLASCCGSLAWLIYLSLMAEGFFGYLLPWGNMSYWGAQVIRESGRSHSCSSVHAVGGPGCAGDYLISGATLNRFFAMHVAGDSTGVWCALVFMHLGGLASCRLQQPGWC
jgi:ubiquinol-cytochrome c reductase cytochrome b subunit